MSERIYCSEVALQMDAPLVGTAVPVDAWLLIEYPRPWKAKALIDNELDPKINTLLEDLPAQFRALTGARMRVQWIKQAAWADVVQPRIFLVRDGQVLAGELPSYQAIGRLAAADLAAGLIPGGRSSAAPLYLVCTNGQRDLCCARFGLPLYEALRVEFGGTVWQTTHVGGHRYAPNLLCLPSGCVYGYVMPELGASIVRADQQGLVYGANLRGRACLEEAAQAAEVFAVRAAGEAPHTSSPAVIHSCDKQADEIAVRLSLHGEKRTITMRHVAQHHIAIASCGKSEKAIDGYELLEVADG
ncbi:MAG: sucrase ferredoxin [Pseudomonadota bacterium]